MCEVPSNAYPHAFLLEAFAVCASLVLWDSRGVNDKCRQHALEARLICLMCKHVCIHGLVEYILGRHGKTARY
eukprot:10767947-Prorocentrum_lima.AAC.1